MSQISNISKLRTNLNRTLPVTHTSGVAQTDPINISSQTHGHEHTVSNNRITTQSQIIPTISQKMDVCVNLPTPQPVQQSSSMTTTTTGDDGQAQQQQTKVQQTSTCTSYIEFEQSVPSEIPVDNNNVMSSSISACVSKPVLNKSNTQLCPDETSVKNVLIDITNPLCNSIYSENTPVLGRARTAKSESRSNERTQSAVPYIRQSVSKSRSSSRVLPDTINNCPLNTYQSDVFPPAPQHVGEPPTVSTLGVNN